MAEPISFDDHRAGGRQPLAKSLGGGDDGGMDARVARLEEDMKEVKADLKSMKADLSQIKESLAYVKGRLDAMPTTIQLLMFVIAIFVASGVVRYFQS